MSKIQDELLEALKLKAKTGEDRAATLKRIYAAIDALSDAEFDELSPAAQKWANGASKAHNASKAIPEFSDYTAEEADMDTTAKTTKAPKAEKTTDKPAPEAKAAAPAKAKAEPKPKAEKPAKEKKGPGKIHRMKLIMLKNLEMTTEDLVAKLKAQDIEVSDSTVTTVRSDFLSSIRVLQEAGKLKEDLIAD